MKIILAAVLICTLFISQLSCKDEKSGPATKTIITKDTGTANQPESPGNPYAAIDLSPMDMSYFPVDYPKTKMENPAALPPLARVVYSRPHLQGRHIFHEVLKYGEPWRLGANEATELDLFSDAMIQGKKIKKGRYILYCIPAAENWTIVLNSNIDSWGLAPDPKKDIVRFDVPVELTDKSLEYFTMIFEKNTDGANLLMAWDNAEVRLPISF